MRFTTGCTLLFALAVSIRVWFDFARVCYVFIFFCFFSRSCLTIAIGKTQKKSECTTDCFCFFLTVDYCDDKSHNHHKYMIQIEIMRIYWNSARFMFFVLNANIYSMTRWHTRQQCKNFYISLLKSIALLHYIYLLLLQYHRTRRRQSVSQRKIIQKIKFIVYMSRIDSDAFTPK